MSTALPQTITEINYSKSHRFLDSEPQHHKELPLIKSPNSITR
jgi:hypothetical protein